MKGHSHIHNGDCLKVLRTLPEKSAHCIVTSPPYWGLRDYGMKEQIGLEKTPEEYIEKIVHVFREVKRVLRDDGTCWLNLGDSYCGSGQGWGKNGKSRGRNSIDTRPVEILCLGKPPTYKVNGLKPKDLVGIPWRVVFALQQEGWYLRSDIIWHKPNPMPESVRDRPTKSHEYIFLLTKSNHYFYDVDAVREPQSPTSLQRLRHGWNGNKKRDWPKDSHNNFDRYMGKTDAEIKNLKGRNRRSVWTIPTRAYPGAHFATFPEKLVEPCILAGCPKGGFVLDPFCGAGTTGLVALRLGRKFVGVELNPKYVQMAKRRIENGGGKES